LMPSNHRSHATWSVPLINEPPPPIATVRGRDWRREEFGRAQSFDDADRARGPVKRELVAAQSSGAGRARQRRHRWPVPIRRPPELWRSAPRLDGSSSPRTRVAALRAGARATRHEIGKRRGRRAERRCRCARSCRCRSLERSGSDARARGAPPNSPHGRHRRERAVCGTVEDGDPQRSGGLCAHAEFEGAVGVRLGGRPRRLCLSSSDPRASGADSR